MNETIKVVPSLPKGSKSPYLGETLNSWSELIYCIIMIFYLAVNIAVKFANYLYLFVNLNETLEVL